MDTKDEVLNHYPTISAQEGKTKKINKRTKRFSKIEDTPKVFKWSPFGKSVRCFTLEVRVG